MDELAYVKRSTVESGATTRVPGQFSGRNAVCLFAGATNVNGNPVFGHATPASGYTLIRETAAAGTAGDHPLASFGITTVEYGTSTANWAYHQKIVSGLTPGNVVMSVIIMRAKQGAGGVPNSLVSNTGGNAYGPALSDADPTWKIVASRGTVGGGGTFQTDVYSSMADGAGKVDELAYFGVIDLTAAGLTGLSDLNWVDFDLKKHAIYCIAGSMGTGFSWSATVHASNSVRASATLAIPYPLPEVASATANATAGAAMCLYREVRPSTATGNGHRWTWRDSGGTSLMTVLYEPSTGRFRFESRVSGSSDFVNVTKSYSAGDLVALAWIWTASALIVGVSVNGGAWTWASAARVQGIPVINATSVNLGTFYAGAPEYSNIVLDWAAFFSTLSQAQAEAFGALNRPVYAGEDVRDEMLGLVRGFEVVA